MSCECATHGKMHLKLKRKQLTPSQRVALPHSISSVTHRRYASLKGKERLSGVG